MEILENRAALILEGGAMRGLFTTGVLDFWQKQSCFFAKIASVSAGTLQALSYVARQPDRNRRVNLAYCRDGRYMGLRHWLFDGGYFNLRFIFGELAHRLDPFDYEAFAKSPQELFALVTDCETGAPRFVSSRSCDAETYMTACMAGATIPFISRPVSFEGRPYVDGGVAIPLAPLPEELPFPAGRAVYVLTREAGYRKKPVPKMARSLMKCLGARYPKIAEGMTAIPPRYNARMEVLERLEKEGRAFLIRPEKPVTVTRAEKNPKKLADLYAEGYRIAEEKWEAMTKWLSGAGHET